MARQKEIRVGSIVYSAAAARSWTGIVLAYPSRLEDHAAMPAVDIYWFKYKLTDWEYIDYLDVLVK